MPPGDCTETGRRATRATTAPPTPTAASAARGRWTSRGQSATPPTAKALRPVREAAAALAGEFGRLVEEKRHDLDETMKSSAARIEATRLFLIVVATGSVLPFLILALVYVGRSVAGRLRRLAVAMSALANGDTRIEVPTDGAHDEIGEMAQALQFFKRQTIGAQLLPHHPPTTTPPLAPAPRPPPTPTPQP